MNYDLIADYLGVLKEFENGDISDNEIEIMLADKKGLGIEEAEDFYNFLKERLHVEKSPVTGNNYVGFKRTTGTIWLDKVKY